MGVSGAIERIESDIRGFRSADGRGFKWYSAEYKAGKARIAGPFNKENRFL